MTTTQSGYRSAGFLEYYHDGFRGDLAEVLGAAVPCPTVGHRGLQPRCVTMENRAIAVMSEEQHTSFALALYLCVLADQVMYTYFRHHYARFAGLTRYPKWKGDCPGACYHHVHPNAILLAIGGDLDWRNTRKPLPRVLALIDVIPQFRFEVDSFVRDHMPELGTELWERCAREFPNLLQM